MLIRPRQLISPLTVTPSEPVKVPLNFGKRAIKQSSLRRSINANDASESTSDNAPNASRDGGEDDGPVVVRPAIGRSGSTKLKKRASSSRLSFGPSETTGAEDGAAEVFTPKKSSLAHQAQENNAFRKSISQRLPTRTLDDHEDRPKYSKEYLEELQSSTPNTPQNLSKLKIADDEMDLDPSELEGAMVVESSELTARNMPSVTHIMTDAEIRERKERRARLAQESEYISLDGSDNESSGNYISLLPKKKAPEPRLVREDEDLGEGFDDFVEDGGLSLGKKAEKEARRRRKREMADLINAAEEDEDGESDDSEAERRAAYESAQTRAGMDGLHRADKGYEDEGSGLAAIPKMKALPDLAECLARMQTITKDLQGEVDKRRQRITELEKEKENILGREKEVQDILDKAGKDYQSKLGVLGGSGAAGLNTQSPLRAVPPGLDLPVERGLESLGTTPTRPRGDPREMDEEM